MPLPPAKWKPVGVFDSLTAANTRSNCDECGRRLRYVHRIADARGTRTLRVGFCCASRLCSGMGYDPKAAERQARNRAGRLRTFIGGRWRKNENGNLVRRSRGALVTVYHRAGWWGFCVKEVRRGPSFSNRLFRLAEEAKVAAFDVLEQLFSNTPKENP